MTLWWFHSVAILTFLIFGVRALPRISDIISGFGYYLILTQTAIYLALYTRNKLAGRVVASTRKAVLITGCGTGFGHDLAKRLDKLGFYVFATCRTLNCEGAKKLRSECSGNVQVLQLDVSNDDDVERVLNEVTANLIGKELWAIVNNAGIPYGSEVEWITLSSFKHVIDVNFFGIIRVTRAFLPLIRESKGRIVNVSSALGRVGMISTSAYSSSKSACITYTDCLRQEMRHWGIKVCGIEPWFYKTHITEEECNLASSYENWSNLSNELKEAYGESYFRRYISNCKILLKANRRSQVYEVVDCIEDAITSNDPNEIYKPRSFLESVRISLVSSLPEPIKDLIIERSYGYHNLIPNMVEKRLVANAK